MKVKENKEPNKQFPIIFQKLKEFENADSRFLKLKIWLLHTGKNLNGSSFSKESVNKAIPSLANTPLLAFIEENSMGEQDFSDHRMVLHRTTEGDVELKYLGSAVGVIPEENNARWETRVTDNGEELEYLVVDALMWTKWNEPINIMKEKGFTSQSMELSDSYSGDWDDEGVFHFDTFEFFGACLLGEGVMPAMRSSVAEVQFSKNNNIKNTIEDKLQEFYTLFSKEGGKDMDKENKEEVNVKETEAVEVEAPVKEAEVVESAEENFNLVPEDDSDNLEDSTVDDKDETVETSAEDTEATTEQIEEDKDGIADVGQDTTETVQTDSEVETDQATAEDFEAKFNELSDTHTTLQSEFANLQSQLSELQSYKRNREESDLKSKFEGKLSDDEFTSVFTELKEESLDKVEEKLFALIGKKTYSIKTVVDKDINKVKVLPQKEKESSNPFDALFEKFLQK